MALSVVNNLASLNAQQNIGRTSASLSKSLERLSSGLKINRGADGPAALVISEKQRSQISGLQNALDNTNKAVALVQTGEGALNEVSTLLTKARSLALDSLAGDDSSAQGANNGELQNIVKTIGNIASQTKFQDKALLNGSGESLTFQIGANAGQTATLKLGSALPKELGVRKTDAGTTKSLADVDVSSTTGAREALKIIDQSLSEIGDLRGAFGAFQSNTLETNGRNLQATLENTKAAESTMRDTDFASEIANFTRSQVMLQAGSTTLGNANKLPQMIAGLLRG